MYSSLSSVSHPKNFTKDTFTFVEELKQVRLVDKFLDSFDVTSLFAIITLSEAINYKFDC